MGAPRGGWLVWPVQSRHWSWNPLTLARVYWRALVVCVLHMFGGGPAFIGIDEFLASARTGDVVLMESDGLFSWMQTFWTGSDGSHVALVVVSGGEVYFYESTYAEPGIVDVITSREKSGPMLVRASDRIHHYLTHVGFSMYHRRLYVPDDSPQHRDRWVDEVMEVAQRDAQDDFDSDVVDLLAASIPAAAWVPRWAVPRFLAGPRGPRKFCAQLVAKVWMRLGILTKQRPAETYAPKDWTPEAFNLAFATPEHALGPVELIFI